jgi:hypothetical protein
MPNIINLTIQGKQSIGDGTKIVCMNKDYTVYITLNDCQAFIDSPVKKLVVKYGLEYRESNIKTTTTENGNTVYSAELPAIKCETYAYLGVVGREHDDPTEEPIFASKPVRYECDKSILCGAIVLKEDPKLNETSITENGTYYATNDGLDGYSKVEVNVGGTPIEEERTVHLSMGFGDQTVVSSKANHVMRKVVISRPLNLTPENIKNNVDIAGVVGTFTTGKVAEKTITQDGEYLAVDDGVEGYSKVIVNVENIITDEVTVRSTTVRQEVNPAEGTHSIKKVIVEPIPSEYCIPNGEMEITTNGDYIVAGKHTAKVRVTSGSNEAEILARLEQI